MKPNLLVAPFAKIERAKTQILDLNAEINAFFARRPYKAVSKLNADDTEEVWRFELTSEIPQEWAVMTGEILHNLRTPLDQMLCAIGQTINNSQAGINFPFGRTRQEFETALQKQKKLPPSDAIDLIVGLEPFQEGGNGLLSAIHDLNKPDKHRVGLVPIRLQTGTIFSDLKVYKGGLVLVVGSRKGKHLLYNHATRDLVQPDPSKRPSLIKAKEQIIFPDEGLSPEDSMEFLVTTKGAKFQAQFEPSLSIAFSQIKDWETEPVTAVLTQMRDLVEGVLLAFEKRFFN